MRPRLEFHWCVPVVGDGFYLGLPNWERPPTLEYAVEIAQTAERHGFQHLLYGMGFNNHTLEAWTLATSVLALTERAGAMVAVRTTFWLPHAPHGVDAGTWIPYLTGRRITVGPMIANLQPQYANWAVEMSRRVRHASEDDAEWVWLWKRGVRYAYLGALADPAEAVRLAKSENLVLRYADGGVYIFEVNPGVGANGQNGG